LITRDLAKVREALSLNSNSMASLQSFYEEAKNITKESNIVIYGRSIGTGFAVKLASENNPGALVLESPYFSLATLAQEKFFWVPVYVLRYKLLSNEWIGRVKSPILIMHGDDDHLIPVANAKRLAGLNDRVDLTIIPGAHHMISINTNSIGQRSRPS